MKTEIVHARVDADIKRESEIILNMMGFNLSEVISLFLRQIVLKKGIPFKFDTKENENLTDAAKFSYFVTLTGGGEPSPEAIKIVNLYARGEIDYETAEYAILKRYKKWKIFMYMKARRF